MYRIGMEELDAVRRVIENGNLFRYGEPEKGHRNEVVKFEKEWAEHLGVDYALCTTSGTVSLVCALAALGIGPGNEVIVPGYTYIATALAVTNVGAVPVIVDVDESCTIDVDAIRAAITQRTGAIIPVHMMGMPCNLEAILELAREKGVPVVEDACQAVGGSYRGKALGTWGDMGAFSFNFYKVISAGESGAVVTNTRRLYERAFMQHDGGSCLWPEVESMDSPVFAGGNYRNNEIGAAILRTQLQRLPWILRSLRARRKTLREQIRANSLVRLAHSHDTDGDCGVQTLLHTDSEETTRRLLRELEERDVTANTPADSGRHIYSNWDPILNKRGSHHPLMDPFKMAANRECNMDYAPDMLPATNDMLTRSVMVPSNVVETEEDFRAKAARINEALRCLCAEAEPVAVGIEA